MKKKLIHDRNCPFFSRVLLTQFIIAYTLLFPMQSYGFDRNVWSSPEHGVRFSYDNNKWTEVVPIQDSTVVTINWLSKKSKGLMASCYLGVYESGFGKINAENIHDQIENVAKAIKRNELKRSFFYQQIALEKKFSDNHPVIYLSRTIKARGLDKNLELNIYSLITTWRGKEIMFSCSSDIPIRFPQYKEQIEEQMNNVLRTLQFDR